MYLFLLGKNPQLSVAELGAFFGDKVKIQKNREHAIVDAPLPMPPQAFLNRLGGTLEILELFEHHLPLAALDSTLLKVLSAKAAEKKGKFEYGLNMAPAAQNSQLLKHLLPTMKKALREAGFSSIFLNNNFQNINRIFAEKHHLAEHGNNFFIIDEGEGRVSIAASRAVQNVDAYAKRDYQKPFRDAQVGMLPPKLAQIMINLAVGAYSSSSTSQNSNGLVIYDPFCGTGSLVSEALLMGYAAAGSDKEARLVEGAERNLTELRTAFKVPVSLPSTLFTASALDVTRADLEKRLPLTPLFNSAKPEVGGAHIAAVTEPFLGPALSVFPPPPLLGKIKVELTELYTAFFAKLATWLPAGSPIVFLFPVWQHGQNRIFLTGDSGSMSLIAKIEALGYSISAFAPDLEVHGHTHKSQARDSHPGILYERPDQVVARQIVRFIKN